MRTYTIGEVANRTGFSASALRYYESIGLVVPSTRTGGGYRMYDDHTLARLAFIARAKRLGCSLEEITDLLAIWAGDQCGPMQLRFHDLVTAKIVDAQHQISDLVAFTAQLQTAAAQLSGQPIVGPCGDDCACVADTTDAPVSVALRPKPDDPPIACTLDAGAIPARLSDWQALLGQARSRVSTADGALRVEFDDDVALGELMRLVAAEQHCCAFFSFTLTVDPRGIGLEVRAPDGVTDIVASLFGTPA